MDDRTAPYKGNHDKRIIIKKLLSGDITEENLKDYLVSLPDVSDNAEDIAVELEDRK